MTTNQTEACEMTSAIAACARGEQTGLHRVIELEGGRLMGIAKRMLQRRDLAEEAVQDALVQIWRKASQFRAGEGSARGWVFAILRNRCLNILRDGGRLSTLDDAALLAIQDGRQAAALESFDALDEMALKDCLAELEPAPRRAILLAYVGGYSHGEIAALQSIPLGTCKSWIKRGLDALRRCLS
ncbi:sigma-70 family RNA polymerase sigma factor [Falsirhodobacter xinxiangensis]|uniref:sigma-70 family RNA polymerase sigma factor n=1 Tax=Falsirhodobacter xinxiangensis TaxID=2530049 RepID=UPI0010A9C467|nr:sigma-70 family RNA polymerase sigma factor [Rhodobacter xinxiangensis]